MTWTDVLIWLAFGTAGVVVVVPFAIFWWVRSAVYGYRLALYRFDQDYSSGRLDRGKDKGKA